MTPLVTAVLNHLWQSTLVAAAAWLLTLALRENRARVRHAVWLAASIKFLIPMVLLVDLGALVHWRTAAPAQVLPMIKAVTQVSVPFAVPHGMPPASRDAREFTTWALGAVWLIGVMGIGTAWWVRLRRVRRALTNGRPVTVDAPIAAVLSSAKMEPGVAGIFRPVLLLPEGIFERLSPAQMTAVIAHEMCHVARRDNLAAAFQMFVETVFWFHPLVWWMGKRLQDERERACDEEVLSSRRSETRAYADAILNVCRMYVESPVECVAGMAGSNLRKRIEAIMENRERRSLNLVRKLALYSAGMGAVLGPVAVGVAQAPAVLAQDPETHNLTAQRAQRPPAPMEKIGTFENGRYHHDLTGTEFSIPAGWVIRYQTNSSGGGQQVGFVYPGDEAGPHIEAFVWMRAEKHAEAEIADALEGSLNYKAGQRNAGPVGANTQYHMLRDTRERKTIGGQLALSVQAEFTESGEAMSEYHTWVTTPNNHAYLSARMRAADLAKGKTMVDGIADSLMVP